jgi:hypothetical protein
MKKIFRMIMPIGCMAILLTTCKKKADDTPNQPAQNSDYTTQATINLITPHAYSFDVAGTTHVESDGAIFTSTSDFTMGQTQINDVVVDGTIDNGQVTFSNKKILLVFPILGGADTVRDEVIFSTGPVTFGTGNITGNGTISLRLLDDTITEQGTFTYTLAQIK